MATSSSALIALAVGLAAAIGMDAFRIVHVEIGPSPIQAESKFSQIGPSPRKDNPRKRLGFPWISLSELSLFKDLRGPPGPEISSAPLSRSEALSAMAYAPARARNAALLVSAGLSDVAQVIHRLPYSDDFEFWSSYFFVTAVTYWKCERLRSTRRWGWLRWRRAAPSLRGCRAKRGDAAIQGASSSLAFATQYNYK